MKLNWIGNATVMISDEGSTLVTDPFVSRNPAHRKLVDEDLMGVSAMLVTHGHFDHVADLPGFVERLKIPAYVPERVEMDISRRYRIPGLHRVAPEHPTDIGPFTVTPYPAEHVRIDAPVVGKTLRGFASDGIDRDRWLDVARMMVDHLSHPMGECVAWLVKTKDRSLLHFGSLGMAPSQSYPRGVDVLSLPCQGSSKAPSLALDFIARIRPKKLYLQHFDDAFPPLSSDMGTEPLVDLMASRHPDIPVIVPEHRVPVDV